MRRGGERMQGRELVGEWMDGGAGYKDVCGAEEMERQRGRSVDHGLTFWLEGRHPSD